MLFNLTNLCRVAWSQIRFQNQVRIKRMNDFQVKSCRVGEGPVWHQHISNNNNNSTKCTELGWTCIPMAVETFGHWGRKAQGVLSRLASHLSISLSQPRAAMVADIYGRLNIILVRSVSRAILSRLPQSGWIYLANCNYVTHLLLVFGVCHVYLTVLIIIIIIFFKALYR